MPTITVPDETFRRLSRRAAALGTTVEAVALPALDLVEEIPIVGQLPHVKESPIAGQTSPPVELALDEGKKKSEEILERARSRAHLYPPGFEADVSRESIYDGCGE